MSEIPTLLALVGKSGAGKNYIKEYLTDIQTILPVNDLIPYTTRPKRDYEKNGKDYYFETEEIFDIMKPLMLEWQQFRGWYYGTNKGSLVTDRLNVGIFNPKGLKSIIETNDKDSLNLIVWEICADDKARLLRLFQREATPDIEEILRRWNADEEDFNRFYKFFHQLRMEFLSCGATSTCLKDSKSIYSNNKTLEMFKEINRNLLTIKDKYVII